MEEFLELEERLDPEQKLDDEWNTTRENLETSSKASIDRHHHYEIDQHPPYIIDQYPTYIIHRHPPDSIDLYPPDYIDQHPLLDELQSCVVELEPIEEIMHKSESSHLAVPEHLRPSICTEKAAVIHKKNRNVHLGSYNGVFVDDMYAVAS
uniref:Uncharacterized protein n=1 Tax=Brassica oleracea TaxID=3712 RepID=A0A3P6DBJ4_BRAOL|nr:unnamed protein product [Brassica oleracea]